MDFKNIIFIMIGGAVGATLRYIVGLLVTSPLSTFTVNAIGCFLLGMITALGGKYAGFSGAPYLMLTVGLCGAFTTFSTFSSDTIRLLNNGQWSIAFLYLIASIVIGFLLFFVGQKLFS